MTKPKAVILGAGALVLTVLVVKTILFIVDFFQPNRLPSSDWALYRENFISPEGRVIDTGNGNVSHSEGQGYGMIIAVAYEDRKTFDRIWDWTRKNLQTRPDDKLLSWQWKPDASGGGAISDPNNASDGDILVSWALIRAFQKWDDYKYQQAAAQILADVTRLNVVETREDGLILLPGVVGFVDGSLFTLNLSYYVFPAFRDLAAAFPTSPWGKLATDGEALLHKARFGQHKLTPDWIQLTTTPVTTDPLEISAVPAENGESPKSLGSPVTIAPEPSATPTAEPTASPESATVAVATPALVPTAEPASSPSATPAEATVAAASPTPDATPSPSPTAPALAAEPVATPSETPPAAAPPLVASQVEVSSKFPPDFGYNAVRIPLHLAWENPQSPELVPFADFWKQFPADKIPATVNVVTGAYGPDPALPGMQAIAALTIACVEKRDLTVRSLPVLTKGESYYSASLSILAKIAVRELFAK